MSKHQGELTHQPAPPAPDVHAAVLAGGRSRRFGSDKCLARIPGDDLTFLARVIGALREVAERVVIVGGHRAGIEDLADGLVPDPVINEGPLVGLSAALLDCRRPYLLLAACDQPLLTGSLLRRLVDQRHAADIVMFTTDVEQPSPFPSLLRRETLLPVVESQVRAGNRSLKTVFSLELLRILEVEPDRAGRAALRDIDTRADLETTGSPFPLGNDPMH